MHLELTELDYFLGLLDAQGRICLITQLPDRALLVPA